MDTSPYIMRPGGHRCPSVSPAPRRNTVRAGHLMDSTKAGGVMRVLGVVMAAVALLVSVPADVAAQDLSGMWIITIQSPEGDQPLPVTIVQDGEDLKATGEIPELGPVEIVRHHPGFPDSHGMGFFHRGDGVEYRLHGGGRRGWYARRIGRLRRLRRRSLDRDAGRELTGRPARKI